jgi:VCBS repeat-containing protein
VIADSATADQILQISDNVLANDSDLDGDAIVVGALAGGSVGALFHGTFGDFKLNADGTYTYFAGATATEQAALAAAPNGAHAVETLTYTASDGLGGLASTTLTITIDRAMVLTTPASVTYLAGSAPVSLALAGTIGSVDASSLDTGSLSVAGSNLTSGDQLTILSDGTGAGQISLVGTAVFYEGVEIGTIGSPADGHDGAALTIYFNADATVEAAQALLEHLQFSNTDPGSALGARNLTLQFRDSLGHFTASFETIDVTPANHAPSFTAGSNQAVNEDSGLQTVAAWASNIFAGAANEAGQTLDFLVSNDNPGLFAIAPAIAPDGTLTYTSAHDANGSATVKVKLHDDGGTAGGGSDTSAEQTFTITITAVNDAPMLHDVATTAVFSGGPAVLLAPGVTVSDIDNATLVAATVHISAGTFAGDVLAIDAGGLAGTSILASYNAATETLTLSGTDTLAHYQQALEHVTFQSTSSDPTHSGSDPTRTVDWQLNDGSAADNLSIVQTTTLHLSGLPPISAPTLQPPANDFDGDGHSDILWQNTDGTPAVWLTNGTSLIFGANVGFNPGADWHEIEPNFGGERRLQPGSVVARDRHRRFQR